MRVIVTRPTQEAAQWVHALNDAGYKALALPLIGVLPPPDPAAVAAAWALNIPVELMAAGLRTFDANPKKTPY